MAEIVVAQRMWQRRDTAANWTSANPVLAAGEIGVELGATTSDPQKFKIGNGVTDWTTLAYFAGGGGGGSVWYTGSGAPSGGLGVDGDFYLRSSNGDFYQKVSGTWTVQGNLAGPAGATGATGATGAPGAAGAAGAAGAPGSVTRNGTGAPSSGLGINGDYYIDNATGDYYFKTGGSYALIGTWIGAPGPAGPAGPAWGQFLFGAGDRINMILLGPKATIPVTFAGTIRSMQMHIVTNDGLAGDIIVDVWKCNYATAGGTRPDATDSITAFAVPSITAGFKTQDATLTGWTTAFVAGDVFVVSVIARSANVAHFSISLDTEKSP